MLGSSYSLLGTLEASTDAINALAFSTDGRYLASASEDMTIHVYNIHRQLSVAWTHKGRSPFTAVLWKDTSLFAGTRDGEVVIFNPIGVSYDNFGVLFFHKALSF